MEQNRANTYEYGCISIVVHRPVLDDKERQKREATLERALACFGKAKAKGSETNVQNR